MTILGIAIIVFKKGTMKPEYGIIINYIYSIHWYKKTKYIQRIKPKKLLIKIFQKITYLLGA